MCAFFLQKRWGFFERGVELAPRVRILGKVVDYWCAFSVLILGVHSWCALLVCIFGVHSWCAFSVCIPGVHSWCAFSVRIYIYTVPGESTREEMAKVGIKMQGKNQAGGEAVTPDLIYDYE